MRKTKCAALAVLAAFLLGLFAACSPPAAGSVTSAAAPAASPAPSSQALAQSAPASAQPGAGPLMKIAGLKGPTTMGMVQLMQKAEASGRYAVEVYGTADEVVPKLVAGEVDAAAIPANLASVLYAKTEGAVQAVAINTLGVLYVVESGNSVQNIEDLRGKTVYATGKGTTPEFVLHYILTQNGLTPGEDVRLEYKSESTEVAALLAQEEGAIAVLPQPYVTAVQMQNEALRVALDLTKEWEAVGDGSPLVTGVLAVRKDFIAQNPEVFAAFLQDYEDSLGWVAQNPADAAALVAKYGIVEKAPVAEKALPACNITYIAGAEMKPMLKGYLQVLYNQQPEAVGGAMPGDDFYYDAA